MTGISPSHPRLALTGSLRSRLLFLVAVGVLRQATRLPDRSVLCRLFAITPDVPGPVASRQPWQAARYTPLPSPSKSPPSTHVPYTSGFLPAF